MRLHIVLAPLLIALAVAGCGVRGDLELPPSSTPEAAPSDAGAGETAPVDDRPFILDGLLL